MFVSATVEGIYPGKEQLLPDGSLVTTLYYTVRYNAYGNTEALNGTSIRLPPPKADDDSQSPEVRHFSLELSIENAERMENCPWKMMIFHLKAAI